MEREAILPLLRSPSGQLRPRLSLRPPGLLRVSGGENADKAL